MSAKKRKQGPYLLPMGGCLPLLSLAPMAVSLVLVTTKKITHRQRGES